MRTPENGRSTTRIGRVAPEIFQMQCCNSRAARLGLAAAEAGIKMLARGCPASVSLIRWLNAGVPCPRASNWKPRTSDNKRGISTYLILTSFIGGGYLSDIESSGEHRAPFHN